MLGFFRRFTQSKLGLVITFGVLALIAVAFAAGDVTGLSGNSGGLRPSEVAEVGSDGITENELVTQTKSALRTIQQEQPTADMAGFLQAQGAERVLEQLIDRRSAALFAQQQGLRVSPAAVDGVIASIPAFRGLDGKFSQQAFDQVLAQQRLNSRDVRADIERERLIQFLTAPVNGGARIGRQYALPYAALLLERRRGQIATIPAAALGAGAPPSDAELTQFYRSNIARYTVPERRVVRYALVTPDALKDQATPTDAELRAAFTANAARFAARERRSVQLAVTLDQASANTLAAKAKGGTSLDAAARAVGLEARTLANLDKAALAAQSSAGIADAVFAAAPDAVLGPLRGAGGFIVARVTGVERLPAKTFEQARAELLPEVAKANVTSRLTKLNDTLDSAASEGATFDEMVAAQKLTAQKTPALMQNGRDPLNPAAPADARLGTVMQAGFASEQGDAPQIVPIGTDGGFALVVLDAVQTAAPRPLGEIRGDVARLFQLRRAQAAAQKVAQQVVAKVDAGTPLATALAATKLALPPVRTVEQTRAALAANPRGAEPAVTLMFAMAARRAKLIETPDRTGWQIVWLDTIVPGDPTRDPRMLTAAQEDLNRGAGRELVEQFGRAIRNAVGVKRSAAGLARAKAQLSGTAPDAQP